ncbi:MAG: methyltransferase domain-containing protein [Deltaproteobacteria bacterium]|nr:methyltransferase domain-containing protein [Deltaproteobacteria bacterium]
MNPREYAVMYEAEERFWWYVGMRRIWQGLFERLPRAPRDLDILDAGCGTGINLAWLERFGRVTGLDISEDALRFCATRRGSPERLVAGSITALPFADASFGRVTAFDSVCQVDDDRAALAEIHRVLRPGGFVFLNLPAFEWLRSEHDAAVHLRRRYTRPELRAKLIDAGFARPVITYANAVLFPAAAIVRFARRGQAHDPETARSDLRPLPAAVNAALTAILSLEALLLRSMPFPFGLSLVAYASKADAA